MESSEETSSGGVTGMATSISEYESAMDIELPFGDKISMADKAYLPHDNDYAAAQTRGVSLTRDLQESQPETTFDDEEEQLGNTDGSFSQDDGDTLPLLRYARSNGLTTNYFDQHPFHGACIPSPPDSVLAEFNLTDSIADDLGEANVLRQQNDTERWDVDKETAEFLTSVMALSRAGEIEDESDPRRMNDLKIDEPVLLADPDLDLAKLRARNAVHISTKGMTPCALDTDQGEGLAWSTEDLKLPSRIRGSIANEKLDVDRETMELIQEVMSPSALDHWEAVEQAIDADQASSYSPHLADNF